MIALTLVGQPLPHEHADSPGTMGDNHASRPHFHFGFGHTHHQGGTADKAAQNQVAWDADCSGHTCDAIFVGDFQATRALQKVFAPCALLTTFPLTVPAFRLDFRVGSSLVAGPSNSWQGTPLFLRTTSLRI